jgi:hypothetical protein
LAAEIGEVIEQHLRSLGIGDAATDAEHGDAGASASAKQSASNSSARA